MSLSASVTDVSVTSVVAASTSTTVITSVSTDTNGAGTVTTESTSSSVISVSSVYVTPSTTYVPASTTQPSVVGVTETITQTPTAAGNTAPTTIVIVTSTAPQASTAIISTPATTSASSTPSALSTSGTGSSSGSGKLSTGATIAIAVVIPIVAIAALFFLGLFLWRRRKQRKIDADQRKAEIEDYGMNPNQDPSLATATYADTGSEMAEDNGGYRGWGATSAAQRNASTTLGSGSRSAAGAVPGTGMSETSSTLGGNAYVHEASDGYAGEGVGAGALAGGAMGAAGVANRRRSNDPANIHRGPSNASSAYSTGPARTDGSEENELPGSAPAPYYNEEGPYNYIDAQAQQGPYGDSTYHPSGQPVIRNVQARRNTRIERAPTHPNVGIAQNF